MKKISILLTLFISINCVFATYYTPIPIDLELFLMRKGATISLVMISNGSEFPNEVVIERKSTSPLSIYRKIITVDEEIIEQFKENGKIVLTDAYPESRRLDSYYRIVYTTKEGVLRTLPAVRLSKATGKTGVTFGDHKEDEDLFIPVVKEDPPTYDKHGINFKVARVNVKVLLTLGSTHNKIEGEWSIERKASKSLASFRKVKTILGEDLDAVLAGERVFLDKYPESRHLDSYYRLVVTDKKGNRTEFPALFLKGDRAR